MSARDAQARRVAIQVEITAVAVRYESDIAPDGPGERHTGIIEAHDFLVLSDETDQRYALLELAGRCQAWLEHIAAASQNPDQQEEPPHDNDEAREHHDRLPVLERRMPRHR